MKFLLLAFINLYRRLVRPFFRATCLFRESCSVYVERETRKNGFRAGLKALRFRFQNCRPGYFWIHQDTNPQLVTAKGVLLDLEEVNPELMNDRRDFNG